MPPKRRAPRRRNRRNSDTSYRPSHTSRIAVHADRHAGRHTRSRWAGPLYQGLQHEQATRIAQRGFAAIARFTDVGLLPPLPVVRRPAPAQRVLQPWPLATQPVQTTLQLIFSVPHLRTDILSHLNRAEQDNVRLISRQMAGIVPAFHTLHGADLAKQTRSIRCEDRPFWGRLRRPAPPGTLGQVQWVYPMSIEPRQPCHMTALTNPVLLYRNCDGTRLGLNENNRHHPAAFTVCASCSRSAQGQYSLCIYFGERAVPLCYPCSADEIHSKGRFECDCTERYSNLPWNQINSENPYFLCFDCRRAHTNTLVEGMLRRVEQELHLRPRIAFPPNPTPWEKLRCYIYDTDPANRNYCKCGLNYAQIFGTHPRRANTQGANNWSWLFRMCLICGDHLPTHNPVTQISTCY